MKTKYKKRLNIFKIIRLVVITLVLVITMSLIARSSASGSTGENHREVIISRGDTLWDIASEHRPGENIQKVIYEIINLNKMEGCDIYPGQKLKIPLKN
ncbi:MAG: hypothetical protein CVU89_16640 [Firmicutes bacterium HGW-Firmicutes-14]|jgi:nucleoid-associated protein YgaU|nr:MAG: hypothetical protein CVU89_16640 [Firmicutes bacterium HGW-Firmicutes-14]